MDETSLINFSSTQSISILQIGETLQRVICQWESESGLEIVYEGYSVFPNPNLPTWVIVRFDQDFGSSRIASTLNSFNVDDLCGFKIKGYWEKSILIVNNIYAFSADETDPISGKYDLESTFLHEMGHVLLHNHANDPEFNGSQDTRTMFYRINTNQSKREIDFYGIAGASNVRGFSNVHTTVGTSDCDGTSDSDLVRPIDVTPDLVECSSSSTFRPSSFLTEDVEIVYFSESLVELKNGSNHDIRISIFSEDSKYLSGTVLQAGESKRISGFFLSRILIAFDSEGTQGYGTILQRL